MILDKNFKNFGGPGKHRVWRFFACTDQNATRVGGENSRARLAAKKMENCNTPVIGPSHARSGEATRLAAPGKRAAPHGTVCDATEPTRSGVFFRTRRRGPEYFSRNNGKYGGQTQGG